MQINVLEYLDNIVLKKPNQTAFSNGIESMTFEEVFSAARAIGTFLTASHSKEPIVVFMDKSPEMIAAFFGVVYSGNFYVPLDEEMSAHRISLILDTLNPKAVICSEKTEKTIAAIAPELITYKYPDICNTTIDEDILQKIRRNCIDTDPVYVVFTSGSTGTPKGVTACHRSVIDYIENLSEILEFSENTIFGNQTPLYVDASLKEIFPTIKFGAVTYLIPKNLFSFPVKLVEFMNKYKINTICWVVSALTIVSGFGTFDRLIPKYLKTVAFGSEVFPIKEFNRWKKHLPETRFINLYGPTESTGMCCFYEAKRTFAPDESIPIGKPFRNTEILLIDEEKIVSEAGISGEICIRGSRLSSGYFNDFEKTEKVFRQNPANRHYRDILYFTGDIAKYDSESNLVYVSRRDHQIKHMGHRIELLEIESAANKLEEIKSSCCIFDEEKNKIILFFAGETESLQVLTFLKGILPRYMVPSQAIKLDAMPLTENMKIDRNYLKDYYKNKKRNGSKDLKKFETEVAAAEEKK